MRKSISYLIIITLLLSLVVAVYAWSVNLALSVILISIIWATIIIKRKSLNEDKKNEFKDK